MDRNIRDFAVFAKIFCGRMVVVVVVDDDGGGVDGLVDGVGCEVISDGVISEESL